MLGWICCGEGEKERLRLGGAAVLRVFVPCGKGSRCALSARCAARFFARSGVRLAALPPDYPYAAAFVRRGIAASDTSGLYRACAARIVLCALKSCGISPRTAAVALLADSLSPALVRAAHELCPCVRHLTLCVPEGEKLARALRWEYGIAVHLPREGERLCADVAVSFDGEGTADCPLLPLADRRMEAAFCLQIGGETYRDPALLAALLAADAIKTEKISVERVIFPPPPIFP